MPGDRLTRVRFLVPGTEAVAGEGVPLSTEEPNWPAVATILQQLDAGTKLQVSVAPKAGDERQVELEPAESPDLFVVDRGLVFEPVYELVKAGSIGGAFQPEAPHRESERVPSSPGPARPSGSKVTRASSTAGTWCFCCMSSFGASRRARMWWLPCHIWGSR